MPRADDHGCRPSRDVHGSLDRAAPPGMGGATLLIDAWLRGRHRPNLAERLRPFHPPSVADEAHDWLHHQA
jgi:hypothetical protein